MYYIALLSSSLSYDAMLNEQCIMCYVWCHALRAMCYAMLDEQCVMFYVWCITSYYIIALITRWMWNNHTIHQSAYKDTKKIQHMQEKSPIFVKKLRFLI